MGYVDFMQPSSVVKSNAVHFAKWASPQFCYAYIEPLSGATVDKMLGLAGSAYTMTSIHAPNFSALPYIWFSF